MIVILDWDGTLHDSKDSMIRGWMLASEELGVKFTPGDIIKNAGGSVEEVAANLGFLEKDRKKAVDLAVKGFIEHSTNHGRMFPGSVEVLEKLRSDYKVALYSNGRLDVISGLLDKYGIRKYFDTVITSETTAKPSPVGIELIMHQLGEKKAVMVDDDIFGIIAAKNAGALSIGALYGINPQGILKVNPHAFVKKVAEIPEAVNQLL